MSGQKDEEEGKLSYVLRAGFGRNGAERELLVNGVYYRGGKGEGEICVCVFATQLRNESQGFKQHRGTVWSIIFCPALC